MGSTGERGGRCSVLRDDGGCRLGICGCMVLER
jgi:hypothetical protein